MQASKYPPPPWPIRVSRSLEEFSTESCQSFKLKQVRSLLLCNCTTKQAGNPKSNNTKIPGTLAPELKDERDKETRENATASTVAQTSALRTTETAHRSRRQGSKMRDRKDAASQSSTIHERAINSLSMASSSLVINLPFIRMREFACFSRTEYCVFFVQTRCLRFSRNLSMRARRARGE